MNIKNCLNKYKNYIKQKNNVTNYPTREETILPKF